MKIMFFLCVFDLRVSRVMSLYGLMLLSSSSSYCTRFCGVLWMSTLCCALMALTCCCHCQINHVCWEQLTNKWNPSIASDASDASDASVVMIYWYTDNGAWLAASCRVCCILSREEWWVKFIDYMWMCVCVVRAVPDVINSWLRFRKATHYDWLVIEHHRSHRLTVD